MDFAICCRSIFAGLRKPQIFHPRNAALLFLPLLSPHISISSHHRHLPSAGPLLPFRLASLQEVRFSTMNKKPGDWDCTSCHHLNFSWRDSCQRCNEPRPSGGSGGLSDEGGDFSNFSRGGSYSYGSGYSSSGGGSGIDYGRGSGGGYGRSYSGNLGFGGSDVRPGDWHCSSPGCGAHNFASRNNCFKCGAIKDEGENTGRAGYESVGRSSRGNFGFGSSYSVGGGSGRPEFKSGDWICSRPGCNEHNFASRMECFRCQAPRESGTVV